MKTFAPIAITVILLLSSCSDSLYQPNYDWIKASRVSFSADTNNSDRNAEPKNGNQNVKKLTFDKQLKSSAEVSN